MNSVKSHLDEEGDDPVFEGPVAGVAELVN